MKRVWTTTWILPVSPVSRLLPTSRLWVMEASSRVPISPMLLLLQSPHGTEFWVIPLARAAAHGLPNLVNYAGCRPTRSAPSDIDIRRRPVRVGGQHCGRMIILAHGGLARSPGSWLKPFQGIWIQTFAALTVYVWSSEHRYP